MKNLDLHIWSVADGNDALVWWAVADLARAVKDSTSAIFDPAANSIELVAENTAYALTNLWSFFKWWNWMKLLKTPFVIWADVINQAKSLPFRTLDVWIQYVINNNLERLVWVAKSITTDAIWNWINSIWETKYKSLQITWDIVKWIWDALWSIVKLPTWILWFATNKLNKYVWNLWLKRTKEWVNSLRISDKNFFSTPLLQNSNYDWSDFTDLSFSWAKK